jgi:hypothetical protein
MVRVRAMRTLENAMRRWGFYRVAGCDEVGRGCLAGPVVAAAVVLDARRPIPGVRDSKLVPPDERERLYDVIVRRAVAWSVASHPCRRCAVRCWRLRRCLIWCSSTRSGYPTFRSRSGASFMATGDAARLRRRRYWPRSHAIARWLRIISPIPGMDMIATRGMPPPRTLRPSPSTVIPRFIVNRSDRRPCLIRSQRLIPDLVRRGATVRARRWGR